ncbi:MAG: ABC transporter substrate-binding protein [Spirochaetales bacterium]|nr:ABC transporter substrate-binding protein [Spirochaetales bacterium]
MKKVLSTVLILMLICIPAMVFAGGGQEDPAAGDSSSAGAADSKSGGVLVFARSGDSVGLDPARETDGESYYGCTQIYDNIVEFKNGTTEVQPGLAESWDISADGLEFVFHLRSGVKFHDGTDFNADAVVFSLGRQLWEDHPYHELGPWKYWGYMDMANIVEDIVAVDDLTVKFVLKKREAPFIANLAMDFAGIVSPSAVEKYGEDFPNNPVGTGPFKFVSWKKEDAIVFERNEDYWRRPAYLDRLIIKVIPDATARYLALQKGEVDVIDFPSPEDLDAMKADPDIKVIQQEGLNVGYLAFNCDRAPFDNKLVRQALNYAINKDEIIAGVYGTAGTPAKNPLPPTMWSYNNSITDYAYDPAKAKELLAEAGYADGFSTTLWAMPVARPYNPDGRKVAEIMQAQFSKIGVEIEIVSYDWGTYLEKTDHGEHDMALLGWTGDNGDPDNFLAVLLSIPAAEIPAGNIAFWRNVEFNDMIMEAKETMDVAKRTELYEDAQVIFHEEAPWLPIAHSVVSEPMQNYVMDFQLSPVGKRQFYDVWLKK